MRYLSELPWVPHALEANRQLEWREVDPLAVEVAARIGTRRIAVRLEFDAAGDIVGTFAAARPRREGKTSVPTPWGGRFSDYRELGGIRVPTRAEVRWELPDGPFTYWRGTITSLELVLQGDPTADPPVSSLGPAASGRLLHPRFVNVRCLSELERGA